MGTEMEINFAVIRVNKKKERKIPIRDRLRQAITAISIVSVIEYKQFVPHGPLSLVELRSGMGTETTSATYRRTQNP